MDDNNSFLSNYNNDANNDADAKITIRDADIGYKYEQKSDFKKPAKPGRNASAGKQSKLLIPIIVGSIIVVGVVLVLILLLNQGVEVLDFNDWALTDVQLWAGENGVMLQTEDAYNDEYETGHVIAQDPPPGTKIKKGAFVKLTVSLGHDLSVLLPLPDILSMTMDDVEAWAEQNFMTKVRITTEFSNTVASGHVIRFEINDDTVTGDEVYRDTPIYVIVSKGAEDDTAVSVTVPDFKTMALGESYVFASENGITLNVQEEYDDYVPMGSIISQSVKADETISKGDTVTLVISKGKKIIVPKFSGYSVEKATAKAAELGITVTIRQRYSSASAGAFLSQSLDADSIYQPGDILELCYSLGNKIVLASYVGQPRDAIESWANDLNEQGARITIKVTETKSNAAAGTIIFQDPVSTVIAPKSTVNITVSLGKVVYVPDFIDDGGTYNTAVTREKAIALCEEAGIIPVFVEENKSGRLPGEVWSQSIAAGTEAAEGSSITLKYTPTTQVTVPGFVGMDKSTANGHANKFEITYVVSENYVVGQEGKVQEQSLLAGTTVVSGTAITLTICPDEPIIPSSVPPEDTTSED